VAVGANACRGKNDPPTGGNARENALRAVDLAPALRQDRRVDPC
jgi:hypothetical protein